MGTAVEDRSRARSGGGGRAVGPCTGLCARRIGARPAASTACGGQTYPGREALLAQAARECRSVLRTRLDQAKMTPRMSLIDAAPLPNSWFMGERTITCVVVDPGGDLKRSLLKAHASG